MTGAYLAWQFQNLRNRPIAAFREYIFRDILPVFDGLGGRATQAGKQYYERMCSQPAGEDCDGDLSSFAEEAQYVGLSWYETMRSLRQSMLNLLAAGLFHLVEQQLSVTSRDAGFRSIDPPKDTALAIVVKWYETHLRIDLRTLPSWAMIDELRLLAHTVKHAEGRSSRELKGIRPDLFRDPLFATLAAYEKPEIDEYYDNKATLAPLAGEDLFVTEALLKQYAEGAESLFNQIGQHFAAHADENY